jgi:hypothetical protein
MIVAHVAADVGEIGNLVHEIWFMKPDCAGRLAIPRLRNG